MTEARFTFEAEASFSIDAPRRLISGTVVPWGAMARSGGAEWRFAKGSLYWGTPKASGTPSRVKLNVDHDHGQAIAKAIRLQNTDTGLDATFQVARGEEGDKALMLAEDGVLDGFSIEVDFAADDEWSPDPDGVRLVKRGRLAGVALTGFPAFDDARVASVAASRGNGGGMTEESTTTEAPDPEVTFTNRMNALEEKIAASQQGLIESLGETISAGVKVALEDIGTPQRETVRAARYTVTREEPVYRFDGSHGNSLVKDAYYAAHNHDDEALERLRKYRLQTEDMAKLAAEAVETFKMDSLLEFAPQSTTTAAQIIPPGYRPDLYVPDLFRGRPYVGACSNGSISNATPFVVPTFGSITSGSADHVEGTNPSDGSLTFASRTVTPQAISGRLVLTREIVDSSNPAIDAIALAEMRESYERQTEGKVYTMLNGTTVGSGGTITTGFVPSGAQASTYVGSSGTPPALIAGIRKELARYPFSRFASPSAALMGSNATQILAQAADSTGRPIFPSVGATNTTGLGNAVQQGWSVDGLAFIPAWANTGVAAGDSQIHIFNSADVWVWESPLLTFRFEEKQGPANIELNIFGYFGCHVLRSVGLSGIRIT